MIASASCTTTMVCPTTGDPDQSPAQQLLDGHRFGPLAIRCLAGPRWVALGVSAGGEKCHIDGARRWSGAAAESNGSDCWAIGRHPNHAQLAQLDGNTVAFDPGVADAGQLVRGGLCACDDE